jgi:threonine dehydrogenase-like Zn-dependent dehydrogenase
VRAVQYVDLETGTTVGEVPDPSPGPADVVVAVEACGLCGSDVHALQAGQPEPGAILGHEFSGLYAIIALKLAGAGPIVAAGRSAGRRAAAADVGADVVIDTRSISVAEYAEQAGTLFAAVLECSGSLGALGCLC